MMDDLSMIIVYPSEQTNQRRPGVRMVCRCGWGIVAVHQDQTVTLLEVIERAQQHVREAHTDAMARARGRSAGRARDEVEMTMDDLSMINVDVNWMEEQMFVRCMRTDCAWEDEIEPTASASIPSLLELAQQHAREAHGPTCGEARCFVRPGVEHTHPAQGVTVMTDGEPITERAVFTQRDVDPLGRGNATQRGVEVCAYDGYEYDDPNHERVHWLAVQKWRAEHEAGDPEVQGSDLRKRDENTLRSDQA